MMVIVKLIQLMSSVVAVQLLHQVAVSELQRVQVNHQVAVSELQIPDQRISYVLKGCWAGLSVPPGWPFWNSQNISADVWFSGQRLGGSQESIISQCATLCSQRRSHYMVINDVNACFCASYNNQVPTGTLRTTGCYQPQDATLLQLHYNNYAEFKGCWKTKQVPPGFAKISSSPAADVWYACGRRLVGDKDLVLGQCIALCTQRGYAWMIINDRTNCFCASSQNQVNGMFEIVSQDKCFLSGDATLSSLGYVGGSIVGSSSATSSSCIAPPPTPRPTPRPTPPTPPPPTPPPPSYSLIGCWSDTQVPVGFQAYLNRDYAEVWYSGSRLGGTQDSIVSQCFNTCLKRREPWNRKPKWMIINDRSACMCASNANRYHRAPDYTERQQCLQGGDATLFEIINN